MARSLFWTEKVVISAWVIILLSFHSAYSQSNSITYSCRNASLGSVIDQLSRTSGYNFIYSRNMVDINRPVTLSIINQPIQKVLGLIEGQAHVTFKFHGRHIIMKANPKPELPVQPAVIAQQTIATTSSKLPSMQFTDSLLVTSVSKRIPLRQSVSNKTILTNRLERRINELHELLGPSVPRDIPPMYVNRLNFNTRYNGWYASIGTFVGEQGTGLELQAGMRYLYGVVQPRWSAQRGFYGVYGLGNSFKLMNNFSFNTMYMYSGQTTTESVYPYSTPLMQAGPEFQLKQTTRHHQVKFAVQYSMNSNVTFRLGPVLNYKAITTDLYAVNTNPTYEGSYVYSPYGQPPSVIYQNGQFNAQTSRRMQSWIGWEGSVSYRINFSGRK